MAKRFGGFTPQQQQTLLSKMGYTGPAQQDDINKFMMSSPQASSMMGKYAQMAKARVSGGPQIAMQVGGMTSNITGGFDMGLPKIDAPGYGQPILPVEPAYDPTTGLPTAVDVDSTVTSLIEANPQDYYVNEIDYEKNKKFAVDQTKALSGNTAIMANPDDYKIEKRGNRYHIVYPDGTTINTEYAGLANAEARAKGVAAGLKSVKPMQDTYTQQLEQYKSYYGQQATVAPEQTRANLDTAQSNLYRAKPTTTVRYPAC